MALRKSASNHRIMLYQFLKIKKTLLITGDVLVFYFALVFTLLLRYGASLGDMLSGHLFYFTLILPLLLLIFYVNGLYDFKKIGNFPIFYFAVIKSAIFNFFILSVYFYFIPPWVASITPKTNLIIFSLVFAALFSCWRYGFALMLQSPKLKKRAITIVSSDQQAVLTKEIAAHPEFGYALERAFDRHETGEIKKILTGRPIQTVILSGDAYGDGDLIKTLYGYRNREREFVSVKEFYEKVMQKIPLFAVDEIWFLENIGEEKLLYDFLKRAIDIFLALVFGIMLAVLTLPIALAIKLDSRGPVFYRQKRVGKGGKEFVFIKFRSMIENAEPNGAAWTEENDTRVTRIGRIMRKIRIDELPQVVNILKDEMSFIGPRPERPEFQKALKEKIPFYEERNLVKPGLTGWAQTMYRYTSSIDDSLEKIQYDLYYVKNRSLSLDMAIIIKTINIILAGTGR